MAARGPSPDNDEDQKQQAAHSQHKSRYPHGFSVPVQLERGHASGQSQVSVEVVTSEVVTSEVVTSMESGSHRLHFGPRRQSQKAGVKLGGDVLGEDGVTAWGRDGMRWNAMG